MNYVGLFQDPRIETIKIIANDEICIIYREDLDVQEQWHIAKNYNVIFINNRCCILSTLL